MVVVEERTSKVIYHLEREKQAGENKENEGRRGKHGTYFTVPANFLWDALYTYTMLE